MTLFRNGSIVLKDADMKTRFAFVALISAIMLVTANIAGANTGDPLDVNKDDIIDETDADIVILHLNTYGSTDSVDDAVTEFSPFDDSGLEFLIPLVGPEDVLYDIASIGPSQADIARINYCATWERKDVTGDGFISAIDALTIINWLNSH
jgi:hypothetical protein